MSEPRGYSEYMKPYRELLALLQAICPPESKQLPDEDEVAFQLTRGQVRHLLDCAETYVHDEDVDRKNMSRTIFTRLFAKRAAALVGRLEDPDGANFRDIATHAWLHAREAWEAKPEDM